MIDSGEGSWGVLMVVVVVVAVVAVAVVVAVLVGLGLLARVWNLAGRRA